MVLSAQDYEALARAEATRATAIIDGSPAKALVHATLAAAYATLANASATAAAAAGRADLAAAPPP
jgi:hypothetical protein